jgi:hypothetical protein
MEIGDKILTRRGRRACEFLLELSQNLDYTATAVINKTKQWINVARSATDQPFPHSLN